MRVLALAIAAGVMLHLDRVAIQDALAIANSSIESSHRRFHADYHVPVGKPPVDFASVVSPFRRVVLSAETAARFGRRTFGQSEALAALEPDPDRLEVYVELTFHPLNTLLQVPEYTVDMQSPGNAPTVTAAEIERLPRFGPRLESGVYPFPYPRPVGPAARAGSQPLAGATLIARFEGGGYDPKARYDIIVKDAGQELARVRVDLARLR